MVRIPDMYLKRAYKITPLGEVVLGEKYETGDAFLMDVHKVTRGRFRKFLQETEYAFDGRLWAKIDQISPTDAHSMAYVMFEAAEAYCKWAGNRLPTEVEWGWVAEVGWLIKSIHGEMMKGWPNDGTALWGVSS